MKVNSINCAIISIEDKYSDFIGFLEFLTALKKFSREDLNKSIIDLNNEKNKILSEINKL